MTRRVDDHITRTRGAIDTLEAAKEAGDNAKTDFIVKEALQGANGTNGTNGTKYPNGTNDPNGGGSGGNGGSGGAAKTPKIFVAQNDVKMRLLFADYEHGCKARNKIDEIRIVHPHVSEAEAFIALSEARGETRKRQR